MTLQDFVKINKIIGTVKCKHSNKLMKKFINRFKYIDTYEYWYDNPDDLNKNTWIDVEGIGYGWLWLNHKDSNKLQRKLVLKHAMALYRDSKNKIYIRSENNIIDVFLESKDNKCIYQIRVSNNELDCFKN